MADPLNELEQASYGEIRDSSWRRVRFEKLRLERDNLRRAWTESDAENVQLREEIGLHINAHEIGNQNLFEAAEKAGVTFFGCDTPYHMAEVILELKEQNACYETALRSIQTRTGGYADEWSNGLNRTVTEALDKYDSAKSSNEDRRQCTDACPSHPSKDTCSAYGSKGCVFYERPKCMWAHPNRWCGKEHGPCFETRMKDHNWLLCSCVGSKVCDDEL